MKYNKYNAWTLALVSAGAVSLPAVAKADEHTNYVLTALSTTTISGYVDTSIQWNPGTGNQNLPLYTPNGAASGTKADGFNLDSVALTISKPPGEGEWAAGYNATLLFGPDAVGFNNSFVRSQTTSASWTLMWSCARRWAMGWTSSSALLLRRWATRSIRLGIIQTIPG